MTTKFLRLALAGLLMCNAARLQAAIPPAENLLPADTLGFFTVPDTAALRAASKTSPQMMFWNDPAMKPFHDKFMEKFDERFLAPLEKDLGISRDDFLSLPQGQLTVAATANGSNGHDDVPAGLLLLLDAKDKSGLLQTNLAKLTQKWTEAGRAVRTEKIHGLSFTVVPLSSNDFSGILPKPVPVSEIGKEPKPPKPGEIYFTQYQSLLVAGNSAKVVEAVASHLTGGNAPAIADDPNFSRDKLTQFRDSPTYYGWFNGSKFFSMLGSSPDDQSDADTPSLMPHIPASAILAATGLDKLKSASFALREQPGGSSLAVHVSAPENARAGLLKMLAFSSKDAGIPAFVPADATKFTRVRLDGKQIWTELQKMVSSISPQYLASLNAVIDMANTLAQQKDPGFDLRTALFNNLGDDIITYQKPPAGDTLADFANPPTLYLIAVADVDQAINGIKTLMSLSAPQSGTPEPREFLGHKIYSIAQRSRVSLNGESAPRKFLYVSAANGYVAISGSTGILEEFLRSGSGNGKSLRETPGILEAAAQIGGTSGGLFSYENQRETMRSAFKVLKASAGGGPGMFMFPAVVRDWADFSLLPDYDAVAKYFYLSILSGHANADGITVKVFTPRPPQLK
jgi:hypothetical protein